MHYFVLVSSGLVPESSLHARIGTCSSPLYKMACDLPCRCSCELKDYLYYPTSYKCCAHNSDTVMFREWQQKSKSVHVKSCFRHFLCTVVESKMPRYPTNTDCILKYFFGVYLMCMYLYVPCVFVWVSGPQHVCRHQGSNLGLVLTVICLWQGFLFIAVHTRLSAQKHPGILLSPLPSHWKSVSRLQMCTTVSCCVLGI